MTIRPTRLLTSLLVITATVFSLLGGSVTAQDDTPNDPNSVNFKLVEVVTGLSGGPLQIVDPDDGSRRMFIVEKAGLIFIYVDDQVLPAPFLDISGLISQGSEQGLLGLAFHPDFKNNGEFFVDYTDVNGDTNVVRYRVS